MDGDHTLQRCFDTTELVLKTLFNQFYTQRISLEGMILKPNMVISGKGALTQGSIDQVAKATVDCFLQSVPAAVPGIAFLSGGQSPEDASQHLNAMNKSYASRLPWALTFSFSRAIQQPVLEIWKGQDVNIEKAQQELYNRAKANTAARRGVL
jgi:fructose-bisphosphate aldolase class I